MQEYFDPYVILFTFILFNYKFYFEYKRLVGCLLYFTTFLVGANFYYLIKLF